MAFAAIQDQVPAVAWWLLLANVFWAVAQIRPNTGPTALPDWTLRFAFPAAQQLVQGAGGAWTQDGAHVSVVHPADEASLPAGGAAALTFTGAYAGDNLLPTAFTVNDLPCRLLLAGAPRSVAESPRPDTGRRVRRAPSGRAGGYQPKPRTSKKD